VTYKN